MKAAKALMFAVISALIVSGVWLGHSISEGGSPELIASVDRAAIQALATESCKCARQVDGDEGAQEDCFDPYKAAVEHLDTYQMATACAPISTSLECVETRSGETCWVMDYGDGICTGDEARAVESAYNAALEAEGDFDTLDEAAARRASDRANAAYMEVIEKLERGESVVAAPTAAGCAG